MYLHIVFFQSVWSKIDTFCEVLYVCYVILDTAIKETDHVCLLYSKKKEKISSYELQYSNNTRSCLILTTTSPSRHV